MEVVSDAPSGAIRVFLTGTSGLEPWHKGTNWRAFGSYTNILAEGIIAGTINKKVKEKTTIWDSREAGKLVEKLN